MTLHSGGQGGVIRCRSCCQGIQAPGRTPSNKITSRPLVLEQALSNISRLMSIPNTDSLAGMLGRSIPVAYTGD